jgi:2'-5' RNA ligase
VRTFIALDIGDDIKEKIGCAVEELKKTGLPVKWVDKKNLHITLKFIGELKEGEIENLAGVAEKACEGEKAFEVNFKDIGVFPTEKSPRVIWAGIEKGACYVSSLAKKIDCALSADNICKKEERKFKNHVTIGRVRDPGRVLDFSTVLGNYKDADFGSSKINGLYILKSTLTPDGPLYEVIKKIGLAG